MDTHDLITICVAFVSAGVSSYLSVKVALAVAMNDIEWLKDSLERAHQRIDALEHG